MDKTQKACEVVRGQSRRSGFLTSGKGDVRRGLRAAADDGQIPSFNDRNEVASGFSNLFECFGTGIFSL